MDKEVSRSCQIACHLTNAIYSALISFTPIECLVSNFILQTAQVNSVFKKMIIGQVEILYDNIYIPVLVPFTSKNQIHIFLVEETDIEAIHLKLFPLLFLLRTAVLTYNNGINILRDAAVYVCTKSFDFSHHFLPRITENSRNNYLSVIKRAIWIGVTEVFFKKVLILFSRFYYLFLLSWYLSLNIALT